MENKIVIGVLIIGVVLIGVYLGIGSSGAVVSAVGSSVINAEPDLVKVYLNLEGKADNASSAKDELDELYEDVFVALLRAGVDSSDIKTESLNIYQNYDWVNGKRIEKGFVASQGIVVETNDFDLTTRIVDGAIDSGAVVSWINFELSEDKQSDLKAEALEMAGKDARKKAEATAAGLNKKLGGIVSVESSDFNYGPIRYFDSAIAESGAGQASAKEAAINLVPKDVEVRADIKVQYKLRSF